MTDNTEGFTFYKPPVGLTCSGLDLTVLHRFIKD